MSICSEPVGVMNRYDYERTDTGHRQRRRHNHGIEDEEYDTVLQIPEPGRTVVLKALEEEAEDISAECGTKCTAEDLIARYEDLRKYEDTCFWDRDFQLLGNFDEDSLIHSEIGEYLGLGERQDEKIVDFEMGKNRVRLKTNIAPWDLEDDE